MKTQIRDGALKMIIFEELAYQEAQRRKMTVPAAKLQRAEADFRKQFATPEEYNGFLQSDFHGSQQLLQEKIRRSLLIEAFLKIEVENKERGFPSGSPGLLRQESGSLPSSGDVHVSDDIVPASGQCDCRRS